MTCMKIPNMPGAKNVLNKQGFISFSGMKSVEMSPREKENVLSVFIFLLVPHCVTSLK